MLNRLVSLGSVVGGSLLVSLACFAKGDKPAAPALGLANPASVLCGTLGGVSEGYQLADGSQIGLCRFSDAQYLNGMIEEWTLFKHYSRGAAAKSQAVVAFEEHVEYEAPQGGTVGHPALNYCQQLKGERVLITDADGGQSGLCKFSDGSQIEEWTLFRGPETHLKLVNALDQSPE